MSEKIGVGDLVEIIKPSMCGCCHLIGHRFVVGEIDYALLQCMHCKKEDAEEIASAFDANTSGACELWRLKRIDPSALPESVTREDGVTNEA